MHTAESNFSNFVIKYLGKIETEFENTLACLSGAQMGSNHEKTGGRKSRDTLPLRGLITWVQVFVECPFTQPLCHLNYVPCILPVSYNHQRFG